MGRFEQAVAEPGRPCAARVSSTACMSANGEGKADELALLTLSRMVERDTERGGRAIEPSPQRTLDVSSPGAGPYDVTHVINHREVERTVVDALDDATPNQIAKMQVARSAATRDDAIERGHSVDRYLILSELGSGGMGTVFLAYDPELDRRVAVKLLRAEAGDADDIEEGQRRLLREAQALARLAHPNVVAVFDAGTHAGRVFVAMEYVDGQTLREWLGERQPPVEDILEAFRSAGQGLLAAHQAGLVHRDFKPDNVMVGRDGRVRVMDFGLARGQLDLQQDREGDAAVSSERQAGGAKAGPDVDRRKPEEVLIGTDRMSLPLTVAGAMLGTPAYMAPEQHMCLPADAKSDQFAFCVALYEALYGERPFSGKTLERLRSAVLAGAINDPPKGSKVPPALRKVLQRGLSVSPADRWPSMEWLLDAIAPRPPVSRRVFVGVGAVGAVAALTWIIAMGSGRAESICEDRSAAAHKAWTSSRGEIARQYQSSSLPFARSSLRRVDSALERFAGSWAKSRYVACLDATTGADAGIARARELCLSRRLTAYQATVELLAGADDAVIAHTDEVIAALPDVERCADPEYLAAQVEPPSDPNVAARVAALEAKLERARALGVAGDDNAANELLESVETEVSEVGFGPITARWGLAIGVIRSHAGDGTNARDRLRAAYFSAMEAHDDEAAIEIARELAFASGYVLARYDEGELWLDQASALLLRNKAMPDSTRASIMRTRAVILDEQARHQDAVTELRTALALLGERDDKPLLVAHLRADLASSLHMVGEFDEAKATMEAARAVFVEQLGEAHPQLAMIENNYGSLLQNTGDYVGARASFERAIAILTEVYGEDHPDLAGARNNLGTVLQAEGDFEGALVLHEFAARAIEANKGQFHPHLVVPKLALASALRSLGRHSEALEHLRRAEEIRARTFGAEHHEVASVRDEIGATLQALGRNQEARGHHEFALRVMREQLGEDATALSYVYFNLATLELREGALEKARDYAQRALDDFSRLFGGQHITVGLVDGLLAAIELKQGKVDEALRRVERALKTLEVAVGPQYPDLAALHITRAQALIARGDVEQAVAALEAALALREQIEAHDLSRAQARAELAHALRLLRKPEAQVKVLASAAHEELVALGPAASLELAELDAWWSGD